MTAALCTIFFCSGAAALLFETLWFRQAGLLLGNTVWTSVLVTASFMAGLAVGNAFAITRAWRLARPLRFYARLEVMIAVTGVALVYGLPSLIPALAPLLSALSSGPAIDGFRIVSAFLLLVVPSSAMGATLPVLTRALAAADANFGRVLGRLYGWNTLGAVAGALASEAFLIHDLGVHGTALAAGGLNLFAAAAATVLDRRQPVLDVVAPDPATASLNRHATRIVASTFIAGGLLLALEIVWFRFLLLSVVATTVTFAVMLAVVLLGIAIGGLVASVCLSRWPLGHRHASAVALAGGIGVAVTYAAFDHALAPYGDNLIWAWPDVFVVSMKLMLPVCIASGVLFTFLGRALHDELGEETRAAGHLTLANTIGGMLGSIAAGFILLPLVGIERSLMLITLAYGLAAALVPGEAGHGRWMRASMWAVFAVVIALFPSGTMSARYMSRVATRWGREGGRVAAAKEGLTETVFIFRRDSLGEPLSWRLVTNGMGMSATDYVAHRYMGLFVWWPVAVRPEPHSALLISYGLGTTARALVETPSLKEIDVADVSADVLRMSGIVWADLRANPLRDPRVRVHVEDGRFFLLTTRTRYDLITAEPPPPKAAGIVNLYSQEYFALMRERLAEGGVVTYWLPVLQFRPPEALATIKAFCNVFKDCSLWSGIGHEWMLAGSRGASGGASAEQFSRQWSDPVVAARLKDAGLDSPEQLGALFLADAATLTGLTSTTLPLVDDHPYRLDPRNPGIFPSKFYDDMMDADGARQRFLASPLIRQLWPAALAERTVAAFDGQGAVNRISRFREGVSPVTTVEDIDAAIAARPPKSVILWYLGTSAEEVAIAERAAARGTEAPETFELRGAAAMAQGDYLQADSLLARAEPYAGQRAGLLRQWRVLSLGLAGEAAAAQKLFTESEPLIQGAGADRGNWEWLAARFHLAGSQSKPSS
jgi:spermidine synthase